MKTCLKCETMKPYELFYKNKSKNDGLNTWCKSCSKEYNLKYRFDNKDSINKNRKNYREKNKHEIKIKKRSHYVTNFISYSMYGKEYRQTNKDFLKEYHSQYRKSHRSEFNKSNAKRRAIINSATPSWLSPIQWAQINEFYDIALAKEVQTGIKYHVDHIHPLRGNGFTGLHVPWNLQIIAASENMIKKNNLPNEDIHLLW